MIDQLVRAADQQDLESCRNLLYTWAVDAPKVFKPTGEPWEYKQDDNAIASTFLLPLSMAYCGTTEIDSFRSNEEEQPTPSLVLLNEQAGTTPGRGRAGQMCGYVFKEGEPTFSCRECATDPTCVLCQECFSQSAHKNHKYRMYTSNGSGYCDCGDRDAWRADYACKTHSPDNQTESMPTSLPIPLETRLRSITTILLEYAARMMVWPKDKPFCSSIPCLKQITDRLRQYQTILFNDETHTYDSVIRALELAIHCTREQAMMLATFVDKEGCTSVCLSDKEHCTRILTDIKRRTQRDHSRRTERQGPLEVHVMESELVSHQHLAIAVLQWLSEQLSVFPMMSDVVGEILLQERYADREEKMETDDSPTTTTTHSDDPTAGVHDDEWIGDARTLVDVVMRADKIMWKQARTSWHQLLMKTVLMNMDQKLRFSRRFLHLYEELQTGFIEDDQEHDVSVVSLSVQMLTVPPIARHLIAEENALSKIFKSFLKQLERFVYSDKDTSGATLPVPHRPRFDFTKHTYPVALKRALHMTRDKVYLLTQVPTAAEWTDPLRDNFIEGWTELIRFLDLMQGMDEVKRQQGDHQQWEMEWETAFNMQLRIQEMITLMVAWANSDAKVHHRAIMAVLDAMHRIVSDQEVSVEPGTDGVTHRAVKVADIMHAVPIYDLLSQPVSIHIPVFRLLAGLVSVPGTMNKFLMLNGHPTTDEERAIRDKMASFGHNLWELQLRVLVLCAQTTANLWRRNGFSLVNQVHNYFSPLCRTEMYDQDLVMLQAAAATVKDVNKFLIHMMFRYRISSWAELAFESQLEDGKTGSNKDKEDFSKCTVVLAEEFLSLIINIISERYRPGVGQCSRIEMLEREVVHVLATGPQTFSYIQSKLHSDPLLYRVSLNETVAKVADFRRQTGNTPGKFALKESYLEKYDTFFYHFSRQAASAAEQYQRKLRSTKDRRLRACVPPTPIPFEPLFAPITRILLSPVILTVLSTCLQRMAKRSRFMSENLLHRVLHIVCLALNEQSLQLIDFDFVALAKKDEFRLLRLMEDLSSKAEAAQHGDLLWTAIMKFKEVEQERDAELAKRAGAAAAKATATASNDTPADTDTTMVDELEKKKREKSAMAAKMRANALAQMQKLQKKFTDQVEKVEEDVKMLKDQHVREAEQAQERERAEKRKADAELYDEDDDTPIITEQPVTFPVCIGPNKHTIEKVHPRLITCVLCQEREPLDLSSPYRFVCAALVQKSQLFTQHVPSADLRLDSFLVNGALHDEMETTTCSHTMHYECYMSLYEANMSRDRSRGGRQQLLQTNALDGDNGEYLCPLCKRLSNTAIPLLPALQIVDIQGFSSNRVASQDETFESWTTEIRRFVALTKPKHSRKRSHSERSLLDLTKQIDRSSDPLAQGSLEGGLSNSVPSASQMNLLLADHPQLQQQQPQPPAQSPEPERAREPVPEAPRVMGDEERAALAAQLAAIANAALAPRPRRGGAVGAPPGDQRPRHDHRFGNDMFAALLGDVAGLVDAVPVPGQEPVAMVDVEVEEEIDEEREGDGGEGLLPEMRQVVNNLIEEDNRDEELVNLLRNVIDAQMMDLDRQNIEVNLEIVADAARARAVVRRANGMPDENADDADGEEDAADNPPPRPQPVPVPPRQNEQSAVQRRMQAIPTILTGIIKNLPAAILAKLSKKILPASVVTAEESVRHYTKFLMKTHVTTEETRSFSSTVAVWRTTTHGLRSIAAILKVEGKPLFGALNTRQRDCLYCLARLSALLSCNLAPFGELIKVMLRMLLHPTVSNPYATKTESRPSLLSTIASSSMTSHDERPTFFQHFPVNPASTTPQVPARPADAPMSPPPVYNCQPVPRPVEKDAKRGRAAASALALFFSSDKKEPTFNILHIDILALTMELMMCIGWTWNDGVRSAKKEAASTKELVADGSNDELHVMRLGLTAFLFQVMATHVESADTEMVDEEDDEEEEEEEKSRGMNEDEGRDEEKKKELEARVDTLWMITRGSTLKDTRTLIQSLRQSVLIFLRPLALLYHALRLVPPPEALRDPSVDEFDPLCRYMGLPPSMLDLLASPVVDELFGMWAPCIPEDLKEVPKQPTLPRQLIELPKDFSDLITKAARFRCPSIPIDEKSTMPTMCLLCGQLLCSQSYCCQRLVKNESVGACMQHLPGCSGSNGVFLRIRDCYVVLLTSRSRGCIRPAPYVDEFGEVDQGFRRGNPMHLNEEMYGRLRHLWLHQNIAEEVVNRYEIDHRNMGYEWNHF